MALFHDGFYRSRAKIGLCASGFNQLIKLLTYFAVTKRGAILLIEDPEIHLHPKAQSRLMDIIVQQVNEGKQVIMTTHSEHFLLRLLRRIREGFIKGSDVIIHYLTRDVKGYTKLFRISINEKGEIVEGNEILFKDFFEEDINDITRLLPR